ncbi:MAG: hypothetical protein K2X38_01940 [Gemmataceae bacterium]|nr:hypothetical protein [Gemmataceae bacterium]
MRPHEVRSCLIDIKTRKIATSLTDEEGREAHSEKVIEIILDAEGNIIAVGDQFGVSRKGFLH